MDIKKQNIKLQSCAFIFCIGKCVDHSKVCGANTWSTRKYWQGHLEVKTLLRPNILLITLRSPYHMSLNPTFMVHSNKFLRYVQFTIKESNHNKPLGLQWKIAVK